MEISRNRGFYNRRVEYWGHIIMEGLNKKETICAVVVTYNRKNFLVECLDELKKQTSPVNAIYLIDPIGNFMLYYKPQGINIKFVIRDLKRLLKYSRIG